MNISAVHTDNKASRSGRLTPIPDARRLANGRTNPRNTEFECDMRSACNPMNHQEHRAPY